MTPEERIEQLEQQLNEANTKIGSLETNIKNQNSYITKLESQRNQQPSAPQQSTAQLDPLIQKYIEDKMKSDTLAKAENQIKSEVSEDMYNAVKEDFHNFLNSTLNKSNTTVNYMVDAFSLVMGRALRNKDHPIHKLAPSTKTMPGENLGQDSNAQPQQTVQTNTDTIASVQQTLANMPPIMTNKDVGAASGLPPTERPIRTTKDAFQSLKSKFADLGGNKFQ